MNWGSLPRARFTLLVLSLVAVTVVTVAVFQIAAARQPGPPAVGEPFIVFSGSGAQRRPAVAYDAGTRRYLIVWTDTTARDIHGRLVDGGGTPIGPHFPISVAPGAQVSPTVVAGSPFHGFLVAWQDARNGNWDIYGQRVSSTGQLLGPDGARGAPPDTNTELVAGVGDQHMPDVAYALDSDRFFVIWVEARTPASSESDASAAVGIGGRLVSVSGVPLGETFAIVQELGAVTHPAIAYNSARDEFLVVWQREDIWIENQRVSSLGALQGQRGRVWGSLLQPYPAPIPDVIYNPAVGEYLVVWDDASDDNIYGYRVSIDGQPIGGERIRISSADGLQVRPRVGAHSTGYLVAWGDDRAASNGDVYGQLLSTAGERTDAEGTPGAPAGSNTPLATAIPRQQEPALLYNPDGVEYLLAWAEERLEGPDILAKRIWFPPLGPRPTPTPTPTLTPTVTMTPPPVPAPQYLGLILRSWSED